MARFLKKYLITIVLYLVLLIGLCLLLYPSVANWWNSMHQSRAIASYVEAVEDMDSDKIDAMFEETRAYNGRLAEREMNLLLTGEELTAYASVLDVSGTGIMGYVRIPKINSSQPIYHGADEAVLQVAVGHIPGTSFPVGGESTHSVLSGHRGLPSAKLFTDLDQMQEGDLFMITVLDQTITYKVDQIRIVEPEDISELQIIPGEDHCTLVTCTPYGINTHRLLVRGVRIENIAERFAVIAEAVRISPHIAILLVGIPILFVALIVLVAYFRCRRKPKTEQELMDGLKSLLEKEIDS